MVVLKDSSFLEIIQFLEAADIYGKGIPTKEETGEVVEGQDSEDSKTNFVSHEARILKKIYLKLQD